MTHIRERVHGGFYCNSVAGRQTEVGRMSQQQY